MKPAQAAARGGAITIAAQLVRLAMVAVSTVVLARLIEPTSFGVMAMALTVVALAEVLRDLGFSMAALRAADLTRGQHSNLFWLSAASGLALAIGAYVAAPALGAFYGSQEVVPLLQLLSVVFLINGLAAQFRVHINRELRFGALALTDLVPYAAGLAVAIWLGAEGFQYWALAWQNLVVGIVALVLVVAYSGWLPGPPRRGAKMRELFSFSASFSASQVVTYSMRNVDSISLGRVYGAQELGLYDRAYQVMMMPLNFVVSPLFRVAVPILSRVSAAEFRRFLSNAQLLILYSTSLPFFLLAALSEPMVDILLGENWTAAAPVLAILCVGGAFRTAAQVSFWAFLARGLAGAFLKFQLVAQGLVIIAMVGGLPWGAIGVATGHSIGFAVYWLVSIIWAARSTPADAPSLLTDGVRTILFRAAPAGLLAFAAAQFHDAPWERLAIGAVVFAAWIVASALLPAGRRDVRRLRAILRKARASGRVTDDD